MRTLDRLDGTIVATDLRQLPDGRWRVVAWYLGRKVAVFWLPASERERAYRLHADAETVRYGLWVDDLI